jgi:hypothetical protein
MECNKRIRGDAALVKLDGEEMGKDSLCLGFPFIDDSSCLKNGGWKSAGRNAFDLRSGLAFLLQPIFQLRGDLWNIFLLKAFDDEGAFIFTGLWISVQFNREFVRKFMKVSDDIFHLRGEETCTPI